MWVINRDYSLDEKQDYNENVLPKLTNSLKVSVITRPDGKTLGWRIEFIWSVV